LPVTILIRVNFLAGSAVGTSLAASSGSKAQRISIRRSSLAFVNANWFYPAVIPVERPIGLNHLDSDFCWCDPIIELDDNGEEVVLHRQVTWH
jgi:hypothetical protein